MNDTVGLFMLGTRCKSSKPGQARLRLWDSLQPGYSARQVDRCRRDHMLQVRFGQADVAGAAQIKRTGTLRDGAFDPGAGFIAFLEFRGLLTLTSRLQSHILGTWFQFQSARMVLGPGTLRATRTGVTVVRVKVDLNEFPAASIFSGSPTLTQLAFRTGNGLGLPIDAKTGDVETRFASSTSSR